MRRAIGMVMAVVALAVALGFAGTAMAGGRPLTASLSGANEVPPASTGDPDGSGMAAVTMNPGQGEICFEVATSNIATIILAHIHRGGAGVNGPVVVDFKGQTSGCVSADRALIKAIIQDPAGYYVNIHTTEFPGGAVRGQLSK